MAHLRLYRPAEAPRRRSSRRVVPRPRNAGPLVWRADTWEERFALWEWNHPRLAFLVAALIFGAAGVLLAACLVGGWLR